MPTTSSQGKRPERTVMHRLYARCRPGSRSPIRRVHRGLFQSPGVMRVVFATRVVNDEPRRYIADLTSILLRGFLRPRLQLDPGLRTLELGAGRFAVPGGYLSRYTSGGIDVADVNADCVVATRAVARANGFDIRVFESDVLASVPPASYDLIFWNVPYYSEPTFLDRLFAEVPDYLSAGGELVLGFNAMALPRDQVISILAGYPALQLGEVKTWRWNRHELLVIHHRDIP